MIFLLVTSPALAQDAQPAEPPSKPSTLIIHEGLSSSATDVAPRHESAEEIRGRILHLWFARKAALDAADHVLGHSRVEELRAYMLQEGITADRMVARGFAYEGYENLREGNYERAREAFDLARSFDPYLPQAQFGYAWSLLRGGKGVFASLNEYGRGIQLTWGQFITDEAQTSNLSVVVALAVLCGLIAFSLVVIARCQGRLRHDLFESARRYLPEGIARLAAWTIFLLPVLVWAGGVWLILFWLALCFRYMRLPEKTVAACVFLMIGLAPVGVTAVLERVQDSTNPETQVVVSAMQAGYNPETLRKLEKVIAEHDDEVELHLLLGIAYAKGDFLAEAFDEYQTVLNREPLNPAALVDIGNIYFRLGEYAQAVTHYKTAAQARPDLVSAFWNMHLAQNELLHFAEADVSLAKARDRDPVLSGQLLARRKGEDGNALLLEEPASLGRIKRALQLEGERPAAQLQALVNPLSIASAVAMLFALLWSLGDSSSTAQACSRCGRAHCSRCRADQGSSGCCARCVHLLFRKDGVTGEMRSEAQGRLERRDRLTMLIRRLLSLVLPGSGQILAGRIGIGFPLMMGWVFAGIFLIGRERLLLAPRVPVSDLPSPGLIVAAFCMAVLWIAGNTISTKRTMATETADGA